MKPNVFILSLFIVCSFEVLKAQHQQIDAADMVISAEDELPADSVYYINYIPFYENSFGIAHSNISAIFTEGYWIPDNYEFSWWLKNTIYLQAGAFAVSADNTPGEYFFTNGFGLYVGSTIKLFLFRNAYFTPSWNIYYDQYSKSDSLKNWSVATGPTASFEYFISNRFSLRLDMFNINIAVGSPEGFNHIYYTVHRLFGLGVRYNFDFKNRIQE